MACPEMAYKDLFKPLVEECVSELAALAHKDHVSPALERKVPSPRCDWVLLALCRCQFSTETCIMTPAAHRWRFLTRDWRPVRKSS